MTNQSRRGFLGAFAAVAAAPSVLKGPIPQPKTVAEQVDRVRPNYGTMSLVPAVSRSYLVTQAYYVSGPGNHFTISEVLEHNRLMQEADKRRNRG